MNIFKKIVSSVYSPDFYKTIPESSFGSAIGYFSLLSLFLAVIYLIIAIPTLLQSSNQIEKYITKLVNSYPENLQVLIKDGKVSTNVTEPYYLYSDNGEKIGVLDTKTPYSASKFAEYNVFFWVAKDSAFIKNSSGEVQVEDLSKISNFTLNKEVVNTFRQKIDPYVSYVNPIVCIFSFLGRFMVSFGRLTYLIFFALPILLVLKIMKIGANYKAAYKVGIYAMTLPLIVEIILSFFKFKGFPFMFSLITLAIIILNFALHPKSEINVTTNVPNVPNVQLDQATPTENNIQ